MKIRLDENLSHRVAGAVRCICGNRPGYEVSHNRERAMGEPDPLWLKKFSEEDGDCVISGDFRILQNWPDLIAYHESGLTAFFPSPAFGRLKGFPRAAFILRWWPSIVDKAKSSQPGSCWRIPMQWTPDINSFEELADPRLQEDERLMAARQNGSRSPQPLRSGAAD